MMKTAILFVCTFTVASIAFADAHPVPPTPAAVDDVLYVRSFTLEEGYKFDWRKEKPTVTSGTILVLKVNPDLVIPRQMPEPVLYVGNQTAQRVNHGNESGHVIAIVPGDVDVAKEPAWFGAPDLPERVDANIIQAERTLADAANIKPLDAEKIEAAKAKGGAALNAANLHALLRGEIADLILEYAPQEKHLAETFRLPVVQRSAKPAVEKD